MSARSNLALLEAESGQLEAARRGLEEVRRQTRGTPSRQQYANCTSNLAEVRRLQGALDDARTLLEEAHALLLAMRSRLWLAAHLCKCVELEDDCGRPAAVRARLGELLELPASPLQPRMLSEARLKLAVLDAEEGRVEPALESMRRELNFLRQYDYFYLPPQLCAARILRAACDWDGARRAAEEGLAARTTRSYERPLLLLELARSARDSGAGEEAQQLLRQARRQLRRLGMAQRAGWPL
jgi:hypothetical protein